MSNKRTGLFDVDGNEIKLGDTLEDIYLFNRGGKVVEKDGNYWLEMYNEEETVCFPKGKCLIDFTPKNKRIVVVGK